MPEPLGLTHQQNIANFSIFSAHSTKATLCLFWSGKPEPDARVPMQGPYIGIWHIAIEELPKGASYAYQFEGKDDSFDANRLLSDPYARAYTSFYPWGDFSKPRLPFLCACDPLPSFDWQGIEPPQIPLENLVIYEMHIRGFTTDPSSAVSSPGTYAGVIEKIPYLKKLGVNAVELMPIFEFDETHSHHINPETKQPQLNYWGYSPLSFFLPMSRYASHPENAAVEFKTMVRELHRAGIEVILDVVYIHKT
jgi:isoamylase/glycogen operon protein